MKNHKYNIIGHFIAIFCFFSVLPERGYSQAIGSNHEITEIEDFMYEYISTGHICGIGIQLLLPFGEKGSDAAVNLLERADSGYERYQLMLILGVLESNGAKHVPFVLDYINERFGKAITKHDYESFLVAFDILARLNPSSPDVLSFLKDAVDEQFWDQSNLPSIVEYESQPFVFGQTKTDRNNLVKDRIRKHAAEALGWIGGEESKRILQEESAKATLNHEYHLANFFSKTAEYITQYGSLKEMNRN